MECECGNPDWGLNCVCEWVKNNPGDKTYGCEFCGYYIEVSGPNCNQCVDWEIVREEKRAWAEESACVGEESRRALAEADEFIRRQGWDLEE